MATAVGNRGELENGSAELLKALSLMEKAVRAIWHFDFWFCSKSLSASQIPLL